MFRFIATLKRAKAVLVLEFRKACNIFSAYNLCVRDVLNLVLEAPTVISLYTISISEIRLYPQPSIAAPLLQVISNPFLYPSPTSVYSLSVV